MTWRAVSNWPCLKGTYGMRGTTLGERISAGGAVGEYSYSSDDYEAGPARYCSPRHISLPPRTSPPPSLSPSLSPSLCLSPSSCGG